MLSNHPFSSPQSLDPTGTPLLNTLSPNSNQNSSQYPPNIHSPNGTPPLLRQGSSTNNPGFPFNPTSTISNGPYNPARSSIPGPVDIKMSNIEQVQLNSYNHHLHVQNNHQNNQNNSQNSLSTPQPQRQFNSLLPQTQSNQNYNSASPGMFNTALSTPSHPTNNHPNLLQSSNLSHTAPAPRSTSSIPLSTPSSLSQGSFSVSGTPIVTSLNPLIQSQVNQQGLSVATTLYSPSTPISNMHLLNSMPRPISTRQENSFQQTTPTALQSRISFPQSAGSVNSTPNSTNHSIANPLSCGYSHVQSNSQSLFANPLGQISPGQRTGPLLSTSVSNTPPISAQYLPSNNNQHSSQHSSQHNNQQNYASYNYSSFAPHSQSLTNHTPVNTSTPIHSQQQTPIQPPIPAQPQSFFKKQQQLLLQQQQQQQQQQTPHSNQDDGQTHHNQSQLQQSKPNTSYPHETQQDDYMDDLNVVTTRSGRVTRRAVLQTDFPVGAAKPILAPARASGRRQKTKDDSDDEGPGADDHDDDDDDDGGGGGGESGPSKGSKLQPNLEGLSTEEKQRFRLNRKAELAREARKRKKDYVHDLEAQVQEQLIQVTALRSSLADANAQVGILKQQLQTQAQSKALLAESSSLNQPNSNSTTSTTPYLIPHNEIDSMSQQKKILHVLGGHQLVEKMAEVQSNIIDSYYRNRSRDTATTLSALENNNEGVTLLHSALNQSCGVLNSHTPISTDSKRVIDDLFSQLHQLSAAESLVATSLFDMTAKSMTPSPEAKLLLAVLAQQITDDGNFLDQKTQIWNVLANDGLKLTQIQKDALLSLAPTAKSFWVSQSSAIESLHQVYSFQQQQLGDITDFLVKIQEQILTPKQNLLLYQFVSKSGWFLKLIQQQLHGPYQYGVSQSQSQIQSPSHTPPQTPPQTPQTVGVGQIVQSIQGNNQPSHQPSQFSLTNHYANIKPTSPLPPFSPAGQTPQTSYQQFPINQGQLDGDMSDAALNPLRTTRR